MTRTTANVRWEDLGDRIDGICGCCHAQATNDLDTTCMVDVKGMRRGSIGYFDQAGPANIVITFHTRERVHRPDHVGERVAIPFHEEGKPNPLTMKLKKGSMAELPNKLAGAIPWLIPTVRDQVNPANPLSLELYVYVE